jgi:phosphatidylserine synthase
MILQADSLVDTLIINYAVVPVLVSYECGFTNTFEMSGLSYTRHLIDSVSLIKNIADLENEENLKIFL